MKDGLLTTTLTWATIATMATTKGRDYGNAIRLALTKEVRRALRVLAAQHDLSFSGYVATVLTRHAKNNSPKAPS